MFNFDNLPEEVKALPYWGVASMEIEPATGMPSKRPLHPITGNSLAVNEPEAWASFAEARAAVEGGKYGALGFCLTPESGITVIDLDWKELLPRQDQNAIDTIIEVFDTYKEVSISRKGQHIILKDKCGGSLNRRPVEVYDRKRFMICTGWIVGNSPLRSFPEALEQLIYEIERKDKSKPFSIPDVEQRFSDEEIQGRARNARNGEKFARLFDTSHDVGSDPSAVDLALMQMLLFWSKNYEQTLRLFRKSGKYRPEGKKGHSPTSYENDYLPRTLRAASAKLASDATPSAVGTPWGRFWPRNAVTPDNLWGSFSRPSLPTDILPSVISMFAEGKAWSTGADMSGFAMAALTECASAISDGVVLEMIEFGVGPERWAEPARLWTMLIGAPSTKKSPIMAAADKPLRDIDLHQRRIYEAQKKEYEKRRSEGDTSQEPPTRHSRRIEDTTQEAALDAMARNPHGCLLYADELKTWLGNMERYAARGKSGERGFWLQTFNGGYYTLDRVSTNRSSFAENIGLCIIGGIQPEAIRDIATGSIDDGLIQRFLPIMINSATIGQDQNGLIDVETPYRNLISQLIQIGPASIKMSAGARSVFKRCQQKFHDLQAIEIVSPKLASHIGKYDGLFGRLCILFHCIETVSLNSVATEVSEEAAARVECLINDFLLQHAYSFYLGLLDDSDEDAAVKKLAGFILAHPEHDPLNYGLVKKSVLAFKTLKKSEAVAIFERLEAHGWLGQTAGPRDPVWHVNPLVHVQFQEKAEEEGRARAKAQKAIREAGAQRNRDRLPQGDDDEVISDISASAGEDGNG